MTTLTLDFSIYSTMQIRLKGLSYKAIKWTYANDYIIKDVDGILGFYVNDRFKINPNTAQIDKGFVIKLLKSLIKVVPFDNIKIKSYYSEATAEELYNEVIK